MTGQRRPEARRALSVGESAPPGRWHNGFKGKTVTTTDWGGPSP